MTQNSFQHAEQKFQPSYDILFNHFHAKVLKTANKYLLTLIRLSQGTNEVLEAFHKITKNYRIRFYP